MSRTLNLSKTTIREIEDILFYDKMDRVLTSYLGEISRYMEERYLENQQDDQN